MAVTDFHNTERLVSVMVGTKAEPRGRIMYASPEIGWIFYRDLKPSAIIKFCNGIAFDVKLIEHLLAHVIPEVHVRMSGETLVVPTALFATKGIRRTMNGRAQVILPKTYWAVYEGPRYPLRKIPESMREVVP